MPSLVEEADWYRAATLAERAAAAPAPAAAGNPELARRRLERWRSQTPFQSPAELRRRLATDGLDPDSFLALLGESALDLKERTAQPPGWLGTLERAFAAGPAPAEREGDLGLVVEPLVARARARLLEVARGLAAAGATVPFVPEAAVEALLELLRDNLGRALNRLLVLELHVAARTGQIQGETAPERFAAFRERLREPGFALGLLRQYPVAARHAVECAERWLAFTSELLEHLAADAGAIRAALAGGADPGRLAAVEGGVSDPHRGERTVLLLTFDSGFRLVYKPRPLAVDAAFQQLLVWLNERGAAPELRPLRLLDRGAYGWVEFIAVAGCGSAAEVHRFYQRQGEYLALFYALAATDFHYENLLAAGEHPMPIDLETLFHSKSGEVGAVPRELLADAAAWDSVLRPGLLPQRIWSEDNAGVDISGLGAFPGQVTSVPVLQVVEGEDLIRFTRKVADLEVGSAHLPRLDGREIAAREHGEAVAEGFESMYRLLVHHREELLDPAGPLALFAGAPIRILVRPTRIYAKLLAESFHPFVLQDALDRDRLLDRLWVDIDFRPGLERVLPHEHLDLQRGDVPLFTSFPGSRDLWTSEGERIPEVLPETNLESAVQILGQMGAGDLERQLRIVRGTFETLDLAEREAVWPAYPFHDAEPAAGDRFLAAARCVGDRLAATAFRHRGSATWLGFSRQGTSRFWSYEPVGHSLYSGVPGIALFLAYLGAVTGEGRYLELARAAARTVCGQVDHNPGALALLGGYSGAGGTIQALLHLGTLWADPTLLDRAEALVAGLPARIERDVDLDVVAGAAGCLLSLLRLHAVRPAPRTLAAAVLCGDRLLDQAMEMECGLGWPGIGPRPLTGLSHGAAGIAWALAELAAATGRECYREACRGALAYERSLFSAVERNWPDLRAGAGEGPRSGFSYGWCHGAPGIGLARLACLPLLDDPELPGEIDAALAATWRHGFGNNHSLCHGDLGNLDILLEAGRRLGRPDLLAGVARAASGVLRGIEEAGWLTGAPLAPEIPGLMTGLAGIGYQLLRLAAPDEVPSVLLLDPARDSASVVP